MLAVGRALIGVAFLLATIVACSSSRTNMPEQAACPNLYSPNRYGALTLGPNVDGIAFATWGVGVFGGPPLPDGGATPAPVTRLAPLGVPCGRSSDRAACEARIDQLLRGATEASTWGMKLDMCTGLCVPPVMVDLGVISAGDDLHLATFDEVRRAVAPVETRDEAAALLIFQDGFMDCGSDNARTEVDGFVFKWTHGNCDDAEWEAFTKVDRDGVVSPAGSHTVRKGNNSGCIE
jgi:hypothetical protein